MNFFLMGKFNICEWWETKGEEFKDITSEFNVDITTIYRLDAKIKETSIVLDKTRTGWPK